MTELFYVPTGGVLESTKMSIRVLPRATAKALASARKTWPEAKADDFEPQGQLFCDKATGVLYRRVAGDPMLGGAGRDDVSTWFISYDEAGDGVVYLRKADDPGTVIHTVVGVIEGRPALPHEALR